jgi:hypothetical protein
MRYDGKTKPVSWSWFKVIVAAIIIGLMILLAGPIAAHASVRENWGVKAVQDYHYSVTEYRSGFVFNEDLWRGQQQVHWSWNPSSGVFKGPSTNRSCWVSITWAHCHLDKKWIHHLHSPNRWQLYAKWTMDSNGADLLVDHDYPYIYMTIFAANPQHVSYTASCGC